MQSAESQLNDDEILLRRVPPTSRQFQTIDKTGDGRFRAVSAVMSTREVEDSLSCSRLRLTSPQSLLNDLYNDGKDPYGWHICRFTVSDVLEVGLQIQFTPTERDPGHCSITNDEGLAYPKSKAKKLARRTRILTDDEIDQPPDP